MRHPAVHFDDDGRPVPVVDFRHPDDGSVPPRPDRSDAAERLVRLLEWITQGGEVGDAGKRAIMLAFLLRLHGAPRSVRDLGRALGMSHTHAWRLCDKVRSEIAAIGQDSHG